MNPKDLEKLIPTVEDIKTIILTVEDLQTIMEVIGREVVVSPTDEFPFWITRRVGHGYVDDPKIGRLQAKLSIYLEAAVRRRTP